MSATDIVLKLEIGEGQVPSAENVAKALLAWIDMLSIAAAVIDPHAQLDVGLTGVESGSDIFKFSLRRLEGVGGQIKAGMTDYPLVSKAAIALAGLLGGTVLTVAVTQAMEPDPRIPEDQMVVFRENNRLLSESNDLQRQQNRFYSVLQDEPAIKRVDVLRGGSGEKIYSIPRAEFAERSGLWSADEADIPDKVTEVRTATWDVVLIKPVLVAEPRRWQFVREGLEFSARMDDKRFLEAIRDKTLHIELAEGIRMRVEVQYKESRDGDVWLPVKGSHRVVRVIDPQPPALSVPLFPGASSPKE